MSSRDVSALPVPYSWSLEAWPDHVYLHSTRVERAQAAAALSVVRTVPHPRAQLADCFGDFLVRIVCECGACREIAPGSRAPRRLEDYAEDLALRMRCSRCGNKGAEVIAVCTRIAWPMNRRLRARIAFQPSRGRGADVAACIDPH